jgi:hypothetical protein
VFLPTREAPVLRGGFLSAVSLAVVRRNASAAGTSTSCKPPSQTYPNTTKRNRPKTRNAMKRAPKSTFLIFNGRPYQRYHGLITTSAEVRDLRHIDARDLPCRPGRVPLIAAPRGRSRQKAVSVSETRTITWNTAAPV